LILKRTVITSRRKLFFYYLERERKNIGIYLFLAHQDEFSFVKIGKFILIDEQINEKYF